jgi:hypothetical protein
MKKVLAVLTVVTVLSIGAIAFAGAGWYGGHMGPGYGNHMGYGGGYMMGPGYGNHMGYGYGGGMMGPGYGPMYGYQSEAGQKFLDETKDLRKELNAKQFEYREAVRNPKTDEKTITKLEKEITDLQDRINEKAPRTERAFGYGPCWQR